MGKVIEGEVIVRGASVALRRFFTYRQNNSGGSFAYDFFAGIGPVVIVEASDFEDANRKAEAIGLYWDGAGDGYDCECCGDRWTPAWDYTEGTERPEIWGEDPERYAVGHRGKCERTVFIHYATGQISAY